MATNVESASPKMGDRKSTTILARFTAAPNVTSEQYDETLRRLEKSGDWPAKGLAYHVAFQSEGGFRVSEVWDSREAFDAFGTRLMPILDDVGIKLVGEPEMLEVHNIIER